MVGTLSYIEVLEFIATAAPPGAERPLNKAPDRIQVSGLVLIGYCFVGNPGKSRFDQTTASNFLFFGLINFMLIHHRSHSLVFVLLSLFIFRSAKGVLYC